jgi:ubiquinone/menaquinone biosynthesis C-methylase UbiE
VLEVGPGTGYYALPVASWLAPDGRLDVVDVQQEMLDHTVGRAREQGIDNIAPVCVDARSLPFPTDSFDAAYLVTVLGEIPDQGAALRELRRVVKPEGRIVVGELFGDPHMVTQRALRDRATASGLQVDRKLGGRLWHFTRLRPA